MRVMLLAARAQRTEEEQAEMQALCAADLDWRWLAELSAHHSLTSLVYLGLNRCCPNAIPPEIRDFFQQRSMLNAFRAFRWMREADRISQAFADAGFPLIVLKGVPLSQQLYGSPHARHVGDLDLLTRAPDLAAAVSAQLDLFESLGYARINPPVEFTPRRLRSYLRFWKDLTFRHVREFLEIDLHWRLFNHRMHAANRLLDGAFVTTLTTLGCTVQVLDLPEQFLHVTAHGVSDAWIYLKSLADVAGFLACMTPPQLNQALRRAEDIGLLPQVSAAIHLSNAWMGSRTEHPLLLPIDHPFVLELHAGVSNLLRTFDFTPARDDRTPASWVKLERAQVPGMRSLMENFSRFLWRPRVWKRFDLPDSLFWLYPLLGLILPPRIDSLWRRKTGPETAPERQ